MFNTTTRLTTIGYVYKLKTHLISFVSEAGQFMDVPSTAKDMYDPS